MTKARRLTLTPIAKAHQIRFGAQFSPTPNEYKKTAQVTKSMRVAKRNYRRMLIENQMR